MDVIEKFRDQGKMPHRAHRYDAGIDLFSCEDVIVPGMMGLFQRLINCSNEFIEAKARLNKDIENCACGHVFKIGIGIRIPDGKVGLICDKSGIGRRWVKSFGGVIDAGYVGEIEVCLFNFGIGDWEVKVGDKIAQLVMVDIDYETIAHNHNLSFSDFLGETERGSGGFGSTGR